MKKLLTSLICLLGGIAAYSQTAGGFHYDKYFGITVDSVTKKSISVRILAKDKSNKTLFDGNSDVTGHFEISKNIDQICTISFIKPGYQGFSVDVTRTIFGFKSFDTVYLAQKREALSLSSLPLQKVYRMYNGPNLYNNDKFYTFSPLAK